MNKITEKFRDRKRIPSIITFSYGVISIFFFFIPYLYTVNRDWAEPINGFSAFTFMQDESQFYLHYGTVAMAISLAMSGFIILGSLICFLAQDEHFGKYFFASSFFVLFKTIADVIALIFFIKCKSTVNIYPNLGMYVSMICSLIILGISLFFVIRWLEQKKKK